MSSISFGKWDYNDGASPNAYVSGDDLSLRVNVDDKKLRDATGRPNDGLEKAFALVPTRDGGWKRVDLSYESTWQDRGGGGPYDSHGLRIDNLANQGFSLDRVRTEGVAFGLEISGAHGSDPTTVWLQHFGDNHIPYVY